MFNESYSILLKIISFRIIGYPWENFSLIKTKRKELSLNALMLFRSYVWPWVSLDDRSTRFVVLSVE